MIPHDEAMLDSVAVLALGALPPTEARTTLEHIATCATCAREYADFSAAADAVGYAAEIAPNDLDEVSTRRLKSRVMTAVRVSLEDVATGASATSIAVSSNGTSAKHAAAPATPAVRSRSSWLPYGLAVAAALVATVSLANVATLRGERANDVARVASLQSDARSADARATAAKQRLATLDARVAKIVAPGSRHFPVATGEVVASGGRIVIALHDLPKLPAGKVYQAWTLATGAKAVAPSVTFVPDAAGVALVELPEGASHLAAVAVSVEPVGGSKAPTSKPEFVRALS